MYGQRMTAALLVTGNLWAGGCGLSTITQSSFEGALVQRARGIHERVLTIDTHVDFSPANFTAERNYTQRLDTQLNLPKMFDGGLDAAFFSVFVGQTRETQNPDAFTAQGYERAY